MQISTISSDEYTHLNVATELEFLQYYYAHHSTFLERGDSIRTYVKQSFINHTGKSLPEGY